MSFQERLARFLSPVARPGFASILFYSIRLDTHE